ncbi:MAG: hypothetical protein KJN63_10585 [Acidimicrobiia bacterium]|nr:hypothetical protein [Acidimicrobiia bacterium]
MKLQIFPSTSVKWPDSNDAPIEDDVIEGAHVTIDGDRMTIKRYNENGRADVVDTITNIVVKGQGAHTTVTGLSQFMIDIVGLTEDDAEVAVVVDASPSKCLTS